MIPHRAADLDDRYPDRDIAGQSFYIWLNRWDYWFGQTLPTGSRFQHPHKPPKYSSVHGLEVYRRPEGSAHHWPGRLFRVGEVRGLRRFGSRNSSNWGLCDALTILEEVPATLAFGPGGVAAAAMTELARSLSAQEIKVLGDVTRTFGPRDDVLLRHRLKEVVTQAIKPPIRYPEFWWVPMSSYRSDYWIPTALSVDPVKGPGHLVDEFWAQWPDPPYDSIIDETWKAAELAFLDALRATLWAELIDPVLADWLSAPWSAGLAAILANPGRVTSSPTNG